MFLSGCTKENDISQYNSSSLEIIDNISKEMESANVTDISPVNYNDFGFINNYGLYEWLLIDKYDFSDINNPYVSVIREYNSSDEYAKIEYHVISLENNFYEKRNFENYVNIIKEYLLPAFKGKRESGELDVLSEYQTVNNYLIKIPQDYDHDIIEIKNVKCEKNIPIVSVVREENIGSFKNFTYDEVYIPTSFIDFSRKINVSVNDTLVEIRYYIDSQYLEGFSE